LFGATGSTGITGSAGLTGARGSTGQTGATGQPGSCPHFYYCFVPFNLNLFAVLFRYASDLSL
jgi:hypothetical protein